MQELSAETLQLKQNNGKLVLTTFTLSGLQQVVSVKGKLLSAFAFELQHIQVITIKAIERNFVFIKKFVLEIDIIDKIIKRIYITATYLHYFLAKKNKANWKNARHKN